MPLFPYFLSYRYVSLFGGLGPLNFKNQTLDCQLDVSWSGQGDAKIAELCHLPLSRLPVEELNLSYYSEENILTKFMYVYTHYDNLI